MVIRKNKRILFLVMLSLLSLVCVSCSNNQEKEYEIYYNLGTIEVYCWNNNDKWFSGALVGTSITKTPDEVKWLQTNLPCPLNTMKEILQTYSDQSRDSAFVCIVSIPPKQEELTHDTQLIYDQIDTYMWLYDQLGLDFSVE